MGFVKNMKFKSKLFISYTIVIAIIIILLISSFYVYSSKEIEKRALENLTEITQRVSGQVDYLIQDMDKMAIQISSNPEIKNIFYQAKLVNDPENAYKNFFDYDLENRKKMNETLISVSGLNISSGRISVYNNLGDYNSIGMHPALSMIVEKRLKSDEFDSLYNKVLTLDGNRLLMPTHDDFWSNVKGLKVVSLFREIHDITEKQSYGIVEIQKSYDKIQEICEVKNLEDINTYLITQEGELIYPFNMDDNKNAKNYISLIGNEKYGTYKENNEYIAFKRSEFSNWYLLSVQQTKNLFAPIYLLALITLFIGIGFFALTVFVVYLITKRLSKPISALSNYISEVELDNLPLDIKFEGSSNEIINLNRAFVSMADRLQDSLTNLVQSRSQEMEAHLLALQAQMNPHFLYNMLAVINASALEIDAKPIMDMCHRLSKMLRYITGYQEKDIQLENEVEHTKDYLELMKARYEDQFEYKINVQGDISNITVPKLILQPIIENCFHHSFNKILPPWKIKIQIFIKENEWIIEVSDNGKGFEKDAIDYINKRVEELYSNPSESLRELAIGGMGLVNIITRLKLLYKDMATFEICESSYGGALVRIGGEVS